MSTNLYDLPKDMLVKLISSIREDTEKETEKRVRKELLKEVDEKLIKCSVTMDQCSEIGCDVFDFYGEHDFPLEVCNECHNILCIEHKKIHLNCGKKKK